MTTDINKMETGMDAVKFIEQKRDNAEAIMNEYAEKKQYGEAATWQARYIALECLLGEMRMAMHVAANYNV
jgi:hypothetical protein